MNETSKYYTPTIEEFHVGFISYTKWPDDGKWHPFTMGNGNTIQEMERLIREGRIKVKHLDREDIESLGFKVNMMTSPISFEYAFYEKECKGIIRVSLLESENLVFIKKMYEKDVRRLFRGTIKNKSELKRLLKQIKL